MGDLLGIGGFWPAALILTALALAWPLAVLLRKGAAPPPREAHEVAALKAQLAEVARDEARGILDSKDAESARVELSRRLLSADAALAGKPEAAASRRAAPALAAVFAVGALATAGAVYAGIGAPGLQDQPLAGRGPEGALLAALGAGGGRLSQLQAQSLAEARGARLRVAPPTGGDADLPELYQQLKKAAAERPDDPEGQRLLSGFAARLGHFSESWPAYEKLARWSEDPEERSALRARAAAGMVLATGGYLSPEAETLLAQALNEAPADSSVERGLRRLALEGPEDVRRAQEIAAALLEGRSFAPSPSAQDVAAMQALSPEDRVAAIQGMVEGLAVRLEEEPQNLEGWLRLITAWGVLGRESDRKLAVAKARGLFAEDSAALARIAAADRESAP